MQIHTTPSTAFRHLPRRKDIYTPLLGVWQVTLTHKPTDIVRHTDTLNVQVMNFSSFSFSLSVFFGRSAYLCLCLSVSVRVSLCELCMFPFLPNILSFSFLSSSSFIKCATSA